MATGQEEVKVIYLKRSPRCFWILVSACGEVSPLFERSCLWEHQQELCPGRPFQAGLGAPAVPLMGLDLTLPGPKEGIWRKAVRVHSPAEGAAPRLSLSHFLRENSHARAVIFGEKMHLWKKGGGKDLFHPWWTILSERVWDFFFTSVVYNNTFMPRCERIIKTLSLWEGSGGLNGTPAPGLETDGTKHTGTSCVLFYWNVGGIALQPCQSWSAGLPQISRQDRRLLWYFLYLIFS